MTDINNSKDEKWYKETINKLSNELMNELGINKIEAINYLQLSKLNKEKAIEIYKEKIRLRDTCINIIKNQCPQINDNELINEIAQKHNYNAVNAMLELNNIKLKKQSKTLCKYAVNPFQLVNEFITISENIDYKEIDMLNYDKSLLNNVKSYLCLILDNNASKKARHYNSIYGILDKYLNLSNDMNDFKIYYFLINDEYFCLIINNKYIYDNNLNDKLTINKSVTQILRNFKKINKNQFYCNKALFINNFDINVDIN